MYVAWAGLRSDSVLTAAFTLSPVINCGAAGKGGSVLLGLEESDLPTVLA